MDVVISFRYLDYYYEYYVRFENMIKKINIQTLFKKIKEMLKIKENELF